MSGCGGLLRPQCSEGTLSSDQSQAHDGPVLIRDADDFIAILRRRLTMANQSEVNKGIIHGKTIELEREPGIPNGHEVAVTVQPFTPVQDASGRLPAGDGIQRSSGAWAEDAEELDRYIESVYERRRVLQRQ